MKPKPTEEEFKSAVLNRMRGGTIRTFEIIDCTWEIRFYLEMYLGGKAPAAKLLNEWTSNLLIPEYRGAERQKYGHWRLREAKETHSAGGIF